MQAADLVSIIAAVGAAISAIIASYGAIQGKKIHTLVNSRTDAMLARQAQLEKAMRAVGVEPPADPAVDVNPSPPRFMPPRWPAGAE